MIVIVRVLGVEPDGEYGHVSVSVADTAGATPPTVETGALSADLDTPNLLTGRPLAGVALGDLAVVDASLIW